MFLTTLLEGAFKIKISFPVEYPFKPPDHIKNKNLSPKKINEVFQKNQESITQTLMKKDQLYMPVVSVDNWNPATKLDQVIQSLTVLVNDPHPEHPLR